ncbi:MAG: hypothetical protein DKM50_14105 [Candidatus Margulisiibacteriota bacterium]|nr:MAG: hypothetical protein A2X43_09240 [Candidatus Margulisbacteria bacterium GWD2_39_127]OGI05376.1 MAG: hypothetical protein A2X42_04140 [Candidatus Margulisbacteria bacterium GWF2_38_17]OGI09060.1 MAG: hypothetical protein A2X41_00845 [Candidatus Margulisbacteria bacterium GWE2_39_32]PZM77007.1 MAG: hypothetical protein DKM50_14105 [Candidatus Margulisiibacteriota bacterium]HAR64061.1 hypothetical protein [Candidatus Margulisiibacteriota bacterium]
MRFVEKVKSSEKTFDKINEVDAIKHSLFKDKLTKSKLCWRNKEMYRKVIAGLDIHTMTRLMAQMTPEQRALLINTAKQFNLEATTEVKQVNVLDILRTIGITYDVDHSNGLKTTAVMLTADGVKQLGIDLDTVFNGCSKKTYDVKNGILVNLDLYQQKALLDAIIAKQPELADKLGFYNLKGSKAVYEKLNKENVHNKNDIWWFWTGERYTGNNKHDSYPAPKIITSSEINDFKNSRFCHRNIDDGKGYDYNPDFYRNDGAVVLGTHP